MKAIDLNMVIQKSVDVKVLQPDQQNAAAVQQQAQGEDVKAAALREADQVLQSEAKAKREAIDNDEKSAEEKRERAPREQQQAGQAPAADKDKEEDDGPEGVGGKIDIRA